MREKFLPFCLPEIGEEEIQEVADSMRSGWITTGPKVKRFEDDFAMFVGRRNAVAVNSATAGLHITYAACDLKGKKVMTTPLTFAATVNMLLATGCEPVFADIDPRTLNIDPRQVEEKWDDDVAAVVPVHFAGVPCDMDAILRIARMKNALVIEDCAHAVGTYYKGRHAGTFGLAGVFSFHPIKNMTTGEGGMVVTENDELAESLRLLRFHGMDKDAWKRYDRSGKATYDIILPGFKYNMLDLQAAIGIHQLKKVRSFNEKRREIALFYRENLKDVEQIALQEDPGYDFVHPWHLFVVILRTEDFGRDEMIERLKEKNIGTGIHFPAVHLFKYYTEKLGYTKGLCPNAEYVGERIFSLPLYPNMTLDDAKDVVEALKDVLANK
ncbi:MAG: DegT/DnrJ/EryC1/StrS aminotransferase family protein [Candidatus Aureabacteria bacterium]|nr:DegT/DnrJ/EryC1/StrS aminotransferase family protein [Candidatus Auribacterota bacterium]